MAQRESRLGELSGELESARSEREQAEQSAMDQRAEVERLQRELGELTAARDSLAAEQSAERAQRQELESQLAQRESRLGELSGELESARSDASRPSSRSWTSGRKWSVCSGSLAS